jgi:sRNA-binding regulator protein Hfq
MSNPSFVPSPGPKDVRVDNSGVIPVNGSSRSAAQGVPLPAPPVPGPRKLVRPSLSDRAFGPRSLGSRGPSPVLAHHTGLGVSSGPAQESTHAEAFYFQKQVQTQTLMVFVLDDGDQIEGYIEWYDRNSIKVRNSGRTLIYKSSIKYLYKAGENHP